jgi:Domain of Unknown Function (DUF748)
MFPFNLPLLKVWCLRITGLALVLATLFWVGTHLFAPSFIKKSVAQFGDQIGYDIGYQDLNLSPLRLRIEIDGLYLAKDGGKKLLEFQKLVVSLKWASLAIGELGLDEVILDKPKLLLEKRAAKGKPTETALWNWQEFIHAVEKNLPPKDPKEAKKPLKISVDKLSVNATSLSLIDASSNLKEELKPFSIKLLQLANYDKKGVVSGARGQYDLNLGSIQLLIPGVNKTIAFNQVSIAGGLENPSPGSLGAQLDFKLDEGSLRSHWDLNTVTKAIEGKITIENLSLVPIVSMLPANKDLLANSGVMNADLMVKLGADADVISGELHLQNLVVTEKGEKTPLISWKAADIRQIEYKLSKPSNQQTGSSLVIDELLVDRPALRFEINDEGLSNFRRLFSKPQSDQLDQPTDGAKAKVPFNLDIRSVNLKNGEVLFSDFAMRPNFKVDIKKFNATLLGVSNSPGRFATVAMDGVVAGSGSMRTKGQASFDDPRRNHDIAMSFRNLPLTTFNPAVMTFAGYQITNGRLNLNLNYHAKDGELNGSNQIIIKKVELGDEVPDFKGRKLPLGLAIALLEDADDTIDVTVRIAGNVDSPEFSASGLVWQAISNVLTNVATAPFRALASVLGMGGDGGINAVPGEAIFLPDDQERLEKFGEYLVKRPNSSLEIIGTYDPIQDKQEMARVKADTAILKEAGFKFTTGDPVPVPSLSDPRMQSALKAAYAQNVGRIKLGQRLLTLPDGDARNQQLRAELIADMNVTDAQLKELAKSRATTAYGFMIKANPTLKDRIAMGDVKSVETGKEGVPLDVQIRIK